MEQIIRVELKKGNYQGRDFAFIELVTLTAANEGEYTDKNGNYHKFYGSSYNTYKLRDAAYFNDPKKLLGLKIDNLNFDKYGNLTRWELV